jgi:N-acetylmuramic acid 6-phosphate etherase
MVMEDRKNLQKDEGSLHQQSAQEFLKVAEQFRLGNLPTESRHPRTSNLSEDAKNNVEVAIKTIKNIDEEVFEKIVTVLPELKKLRQKMAETLLSGGNIFLCGCGATGRLSLALETIWRHQHAQNPSFKERIISFMAGGDVALINSVEKFEDFPEFGERQLRELGFKEGDLLISTTEGGETPFVIGATEAASKISSRSPFFLYCNPDDILIKTAIRSKNVILNPKIEKINLTVGPMALTGSTRMQATTILMYSVGLCLWFFADKKESALEKELSDILGFIKKTDFNFLADFIKKESEIYKKGEYIIYETDSELGISILTDTTERSPTFSLYPFENENDPVKNPSLSYLFFKKSPNVQAAWMELLQRPPRAFHWKEVTAQTSRERLIGFDFSSQFLIKRAAYLKAPQHHFKIYYQKEVNSISFELDGLSHVLQLEGLNLLSVHLVLKILLNNMSTTIMGRLGRYESNLMTWVRASNNKLIDRAVRYADFLLKQKGIEVPYESLVEECFRLKDQIGRDEPLVLKLVDNYISKK